jgi:two-component system sensor histidine kinase KdpD
MSVDDNRPDPDRLLAQVQAEEANAQRGKLKIFFGACAGVGKTFTMLEAAHTQLKTGVDVVVGVVETHGRSETATLAAPLPRLPVKRMQYRGAELKEFDLDAALARRPQLILVDELAHSNVPGSRHVKRWQDVEELLAAGIDVYTTVNVQHLESLNDVVGQITGIRVHETVPDWVFDEADEVELIDLPADDLLRRLAEGKVYLPEQALRAAQHFFRKGNLIALRELSLRRTADRVDSQMRAYRDRAAISDVWQVAERLVVALGPADGERLVRAGKRLAEPLRAEWFVVFVETPQLARRSVESRAEVIDAMRLAESLGASVHTIDGTDIPAELINFARSHNAGRIVLGHSDRKRLPWRPALATALQGLADDIDLIILSRKQRESANLGALFAATRDYLGLAKKQENKQRLGRVLWGMAAPATITALAWPLRGVLAPINLIMVYLLGVVAVAYRYGHSAATLASVLSVAAFDFFFIPPYFTFAVSDTQYLLTFAVMLAVAFIISQLTANIQLQARIAGYRERRTGMLYGLVQALAASGDEESMLRTAVQRLSDSFQAQAVILLPDRHGKIAYPVGESIHGSLHGADLGVAQWVMDRGEPAGMGTATLPGTDAMLLPLATPAARLGVLAIRPRSGEPVKLPEERLLLETFAAQVALAIERVRLAEATETARLATQGERLRNSLLTSISHDLRTPLAGIIGAATTLAEHSLETQERRELALGIEQEAERMSQLISSVLDMARLEAGTVQLAPEWLPLEEAFGAARRALGPRLAGHELRVNLPPGLPLIYADSRLLERLLVNLLDNAVKYTPPGSLLQLSARVRSDGVEVSLADNGPGLGVDQPELLFEKFQRARPEDNTGGVGLGLAICRAIMEAHGGHIHAFSRPAHHPQGTGAHFSVFFPSPGQPPRLEPEELPDS